MARFAQILTFAGDTPSVTQALANNTASSAIFLGGRRIAVINSDQDVMVAFGNSTVAAPSATSGYRVPANQQTTVDTGARPYIRFFNLGTANGSGGQTGTAACNIYVQLLEGR